MARDTTDETALTGVEQLADYLAEGCKPKDAWRIGTEHEKFPFYTADNSPVPYDGPRGIKAILEGMQATLGWEPIIDEGNIIGLVEPTGRERFRWSPAASSSFPEPHFPRSIRHVVK